jgi:uncharacterized protein YgbK (DUF1537 family)
VFKQFDSTLRGHVAAETLALLRATRRRRVIVAPAFPTAGRTTVDGNQLVNGIPVHESIYAHDPLNPVGISDVRALFKKQGVDVGQSLNDRAPVVVLDCETESDLDYVAAEYMSREGLMLAGSTGLMRAIARQNRGVGQAAMTTPGTSHRVLIVVGSLNSQSRDQLDFLHDYSIPVVTLSVDDNSLVAADSIALKLDGARAVALTTAGVRVEPELIATRLNDAVATLVERREINGLIVTGGATLAGVLDRLGTRTLNVCREIEPGIPLCVLREPYSLLLISKAGGFGSARIFLTALDALFGPSRQIAG